MARYIEDWPWLDIPDFTEEYEALNPEGIFIGVCVRYTERRDMDIRIYPDGKIIVRAPLDAHQLLEYRVRVAGRFTLDA